MALSKVKTNSITDSAVSVDKVATDAVTVVKTAFESNTDDLPLPRGTTAQRAGSPGTGVIRFNTTLTTWEGYNGNVWAGIGGAGNPWTSIDNSDSPHTAGNNDRIFVDTSSAVVTVNVPASPQVGDIVKVVDVAGSFDTNACTIGRNSHKIMGLTEDLVLNLEHTAVELVYSGATYGWKLAENF